MPLLCSVLVVMMIKLDSHNVTYVQMRAQLEGDIVFQNQKNFWGNFSKDAKEKEYVGDYSNVMVPREDCQEKMKRDN